jgi:hypothetical protein
LSEAGVEEDLRRAVVELIGVHRLDDAEIIDDGREVRQHLGQLRPALAMPAKAKTRAQDGSVVADEGVTLIADDRGRYGPAFQLGEARLVIEQLELARGAGHEQMDDRPGLGHEMRPPRGERVDGGLGLPVARQQGREGELADAIAAGLEETAAGGMYFHGSSTLNCVARHRVFVFV